MKTKFRFLVLLFAVIMVVSSFAACGDVTDVTVAEDTDASDSGIGETGKTETEPTVTEPAVTETTAPEIPEDEPEADVVVALDFETELSLADYIATVDRFEINEVLNGGDIKDGRWVYTKTPVALKDCANIRYYLPQ